MMGHLIGHMADIQTRLASNLLEKAFPEKIKVVPGDTGAALIFAEKFFRANINMLQDWPGLNDTARAVADYYFKIADMASDENAMDNILESLFEDRRNDPLFFQILRACCAEQVRRGKPLPIYVSEIIEGIESTPKKKGPLTYKNDSRNFILVFAVFIIGDRFQIRLSRNQDRTANIEKKAVPCCFDIIADATARCRCSLSYDAIKKIWDQSHLSFKILLETRPHH